MDDFGFDFGDKVIDKVTGFEGIVVIKALYFNGCKRLGVQGLKLKDELPTEPEWLDVQQCEMAQEKAVAIGPGDDAPGGPMANPPKL